MLSCSRRRLLGWGAACALGPALADPAALESLRLQLDWRLEGPSTLFLYPMVSGLFRANGLEVSVESGNGSSGTVSRVGSRLYDLGFADMTTLIEHHARHPDDPQLPVAVMMVYNETPAAVIARRDSGIRTPADLTGRRLGAPVYDAGRHLFPILRHEHGIGEVRWVTMDPPLREVMLARGDVDAITAYPFTALPALRARGLDLDQLVVMPYARHGVRSYGNAIVASPDLLRDRPEAVRRFLLAFTRGLRYVLEHPAEALHACADEIGLRSPQLELERLRLLLREVIDSEGARSEGFGHVNLPRLREMAQRGVTLNGGSPVSASAVWDDRFLPPSAELNLLPQVRA